MTDVYIQIPRLKFKEGSGFTATAYFRNADTAEAPTTAKYRLDCLTTGTELKGWTSLSVSTSINISVTSTENAIQDQSNHFEKKQITVASNPGDSDQFRESVTYTIENIRGI